MKMQLSPEKTLNSVQTEFSSAFPGLKIVFFTKSHRANKGSAAKFLVQDKEMSLQQLSPKLKAGDLTIEASTVVMELEKQFEEQFGLHIQIFRKSGRTWLETSVSDNLTLAQQLEKVAASENIHQEFVDPMDYREQD